MACVRVRGGGVNESRSESESRLLDNWSSTCTLTHFAQTWTHAHTLAAPHRSPRVHGAARSSHAHQLAQGHQGHRRGNQNSAYNCITEQAQVRCTIVVCTCWKGSCVHLHTCLCICVKISLEAHVMASQVYKTQLQLGSHLHHKPDHRHVRACIRRPFGLSERHTRRRQVSNQSVYILVALCDHKCVCSAFWYREDNNVYIVTIVYDMCVPVLHPRTCNITTCIMSKLFFGAYFSSTRVCVCVLLQNHNLVTPVTRRGRLNIMIDRLCAETAYMRNT
jgi:hypothetical protein